jgi:hypothetical protein
MILENFPALQIFKKKTAFTGEKPPLKMKTDRPKFDRETPLAERSRKEEAYAEQLREQLKPRFERYILEYAALALHQNIEFSQEESEQLVEAVLDMVVGITFPLRSLFSESQVQDFVEHLSLQLENSQKNYIAQVSARGNLPTLKINMTALMPRVKQGDFVLNNLDPNLPSMAISVREYCRLVGAHEGGHFLWSLQKSNSLRSRLRSMYRSSYRFNCDSPEEMTKFRKQAMEQRADLWQIRYARLFMDDETVPENEQLSSLLSQAARLT